MAELVRSTVRSTTSRKKKPSKVYHGGGTRARRKEALEILTERFDQCANDTERRWFLESLPTDVRYRFENKIV